MMIKPVTYKMNLDDGESHVISITPVHWHIPGSDRFATGVFKLSEGEVDMGDIVFDDDMNQWEYTGMGDLTHKETEEIVSFIKNYKEPLTNHLD